MLLAGRKIQQVSRIWPRSCSSRAASNGLFDFCADLKQRQLICDSHPPSIPDKQSELLSTLPAVLYAGFDPTADGLHVGNLLVLTALCRSTLFDCRAIALVGSATALIGDPSGRSSERDELQKSTVISNTGRITEQIDRILGNLRKLNAAAKTEVVSNVDWWGNKNALEFRNISSNFRVGNMLRMGAIKTRLEEVAGINYSEFCYQIFQSADWHYLAEQYGCYFQLGGSDQLGHIDSGYDYIRRMNGKLSAGVCMPLVTDENGHKLGKSVSSGKSAIWLDAMKTPLKDFYDFFRTQSDEMAARLLMYYSLRPISEIQDLLQRAQRQPGEGVLQRALAEEITELVHGDGSVCVRDVTTLQMKPHFEDIKLAHKGQAVSRDSLSKLWTDLSDRKLISNEEVNGDSLSQSNGRLFAKVGDGADHLKLVDLLAIATLIRSARIGCQPVILVNSSSQAESVRSMVKHSNVDVEVYDVTTWWSKKSCIDFVREARPFRTENMLRMDIFKCQMDVGFGNDALVDVVMATREWQELASQRECFFQIRADGRKDFIEFGAKHVHNGFGVCITAEEKSNSSPGQAAALLDPTISLCERITSPYAFYQFFRNQHDTQAEKLTLTLSLKPVPEIQELILEHRANLGKWIAQTALAEEMTYLVHGERGLDVAQRCSKAMFGGSVEDWDNLDRETLINLFGASSTAELSRKSIGTMGDLADGARLDSHRGSALMKSGAFRVNGTKYVDPNAAVDFDLIRLANSGLTIVKWGRRSFSLVKWID
ncbi:hypothetical protein QR680_018904 [Steinernema hermaphroditum]|uniref:Tyrosine--tRNA ligase n=1 Tax=Steinernema hermaphroditum TaxID=289476 RepID=A0AA39HJD3_9BILA|nr:hypothetical protein QR680_018904 [Steinernema hermaphroditum]